jgi:cell division protein FtsZ
MSIETVPVIKAAPVRAKVISVGGAGSNAIDQMIQSAALELSYGAMHTNRRVLANSKASNQLLIGAKRLHGMGTGGDPDLARTMVGEEFDAVKQFCSDADLVFLVTGLGGGTGTGAAPLVARAAKEMGALVLAVATLPFDFEGPRRKKQAEGGLLQLKQEADAVICLPNQKLFQLIDENTSLLEAFKITNDLLSQGIKGVWQMLTRPGLINVDFAYLYSVIRGCHAESTFAAAESQGENRARDVVSKLLSSPLLDHGKSLCEAEAVLVSLVGGPDMTMADVNRVMEGLTRQTDSGQIIMGAAIDTAFQGRLGLTVVVSRKAIALQSDETIAPAQMLQEDDSAATTLSKNRCDPAIPAPGFMQPQIESTFFADAESVRPPSRFVAPAPELTPKKKAEILTQQSRSGKGRKVISKFKQQQLPLEIISRGRFEKSQPTIHRGEDLDVPTYIRRGTALN